MKPFATLSQFAARRLKQATRAARFKLTAKLGPDLIEVQVPHPDLDLGDFWAFGRIADSVVERS